MSKILDIACDEAGHTGPDLLHSLNSPWLHRPNLERPGALKRLVKEIEEKADKSFNA